MTRKINFTTNIDPDLLEQTRQYARWEERSIGWVVRKALEEYLRNHAPRDMEYRLAVEDHVLYDGPEPVPPEPSSLPPKWEDDRYGGAAPGPPVK